MTKFPVSNADIRKALVKNCKGDKKLEKAVLAVLEVEIEADRLAKAGKPEDERTRIDKLKKVMEESLDE